MYPSVGGSTPCYILKFPGRNTPLEDRTRTLFLRLIGVAVLRVECKVRLNESTTTQRDKLVLRNRIQKGIKENPLNYQNNYLGNYNDRSQYLITASPFKKLP